MNEHAVEVENLSKRYLLGEDAELRRSLRAVIGHPLRRHAPARQEIWPLRDVTFAVQEGRALGIIGRNGAGKSTLLRILSRVTEPTRRAEMGKRLT